MNLRENIRTVIKLRTHCHQWLATAGAKLFTRKGDHALLHMKSGLLLVWRNHYGDWYVIDEVFLSGGYKRALEYIKTLSNDSIVLDCGGHIGCFSLAALEANRGIRVVVYEPGPPNHRLLRINQLLNNVLGERMQLFTEAVCDASGDAVWYCSNYNSGGSSLVNSEGEPHQVRKRSFVEIIKSIPGRLGLVKMDIEGSEYDVILNSPTDIWEQIPALAIEIHNSPRTGVGPQDLLKTLADVGFNMQKEARDAWFLWR